MALDFPSSPIDGQVYDNFVYSASKGTWKSLSAGTTPTVLVNPTITDAVITATATTPSTIPLTVKGAASQSANLQEWKNSNNVILSTIDASGNITVPTANVTTFNLNRQDAVSEGGQITFRRSTDNADTWFIDVNGNTSTPSLRFINQSTVAMNIDSASRKSVPAQPSFEVTGAGATGGGNTIVYPSVFHNVGNHYNSSNGRFTAPVAGRYFFEATVGNNADYYADICVNGNIRRRMERRNGSATIGYFWQTACLVINLSAGDYVSVIVGFGTANSSSPYAGFSGYYLG